MPTIGHASHLPTTSSGCSPNSQRNGTPYSCRMSRSRSAIPTVLPRSTTSRPASCDSPHGFGHVFDAAVKFLARLAFHEKRRPLSRRVLPDLTWRLAASTNPLRCLPANEKFAGRKSDPTGSLRVCSNRCSSAAKNFWCASSQTPPAHPEPTPPDRRNRAASIPSAERSASDTSAGKQFAVVGENQLFIEIFLKGLVAPSLPRPCRPNRAAFRG